MDHEVTRQLLDVLKPYTDNVKLKITSEKDSDFVTIDKYRNVGFEVFDNEIIVFYFTDHCHFEDYTSDLQDGQQNYVERAKEFLRNLFQHRIRHTRHYKGKRLYSEKYFIVYGDGLKDEYIGGIWHGLEYFINPFSKKSIHNITYQFDQTIGRFTSRTPKKPDPDAVSVIDVDADCYVEIFKTHHSYTYHIMRNCYDSDYGVYYWAPDNVPPSGFYDTVERATSEAMSALQHS